MSVYQSGSSTSSSLKWIFLSFYAKAAAAAESALREAEGLTSFPLNFLLPLLSKLFSIIFPSLILCLFQTFKSFVSLRSCPEPDCWCHNPFFSLPCLFFSHLFLFVDLACPSLFFINIFLPSFSISFLPILLQKLLPWILFRDVFQ